METELERRARIQGNLRKLVDGGATPEEIQQYVDSERITPEMEAARTPLSGVEKLAGGVQAGLQGLTFSLGDEIAGGIEGALNPNKTMGEGIADQRSSLNAFRKENPKTALGLELGGAILPAVATAGMAGPNPSLLRLAGTGAGAGALAGYGSGEGGPVSTNRLGRAAGYGAAGGILGAIAPKVLTTGAGLAGPGGQVTDDLLSRIAPQAAGSSAPAVVGATKQVMPSGGPTSPTGFGEPAFKAAGRAIPDRAKARTLLEELERGGMGDEALAMNVGDDQTVRAVRAAANQPGSTAGQTVNERLAKQGGALGEQVSDDIGRVTGMGGTPGPIRLEQMIKERSAKARPLYAKAMDAGDLSPERTARPTGRETSALANVSDDKLHDEYTRLLEAQNRDEALLAGFDESPEASEYLQMGRSASGKAMTEDRRGVLIGGKQAGDMNRDLAMERGRVASRQRTLDALKAEMDRRSPPDVPDFMRGDDAESALGLDALMDSPIVQRAIRQAKALPQFANLPDTDMRLLDQVYKNLGGKEQAAARAGDGALAHNMTTVRAALRDEIVSRNPAYGSALSTFADESEMVDAFALGQKLPSQPVGTTTVELGKTTDAGKEAMRAGFATNLQQRAGARASNADLGDLAQFRDVARAVVGTPQDRQRFVEAFGQDKYEAMLQRLLPKIKSAAQNAAARGNSTTTKQLLDALAFGDDAMIDALGSLMTGGSQGMIRTAASKAFSPMDRAYRLGVGRTAGETADLLTTKGTPQIRSLLDYLDQFATEGAKQKAAVQPFAATAVRGAVAGPSGSRR